jgi:hypothetical protein
MTMTDRDAELRELAAMLEREAHAWQARGYVGLASQLRLAAEYCRGWIGLDREGRS